MESETPGFAEVGQIWKDNDLRSIGSGEFVVIAVEQPVPGGDIFAVVKRRDSGRTTRINQDRLVYSSDLKQGYTYLGRTR